MNIEHLFIAISWLSNEGNKKASDDNSVSISLFHQEKVKEEKVKDYSITYPFNLWAARFHESKNPYSFNFEKYSSGKEFYIVIGEKYIKLKCKSDIKGGRDINGWIRKFEVEVCEEFPSVDKNITKLSARNILERLRDEFCTSYNEIFGNVGSFSVDTDTVRKSKRLNFEDICISCSNKFLDQSESMYSFSTIASIPKIPDEFKEDSGNFSDIIRRLPFTVATIQFNNLKHGGKQDNSKDGDGKKMSVEHLLSWYALHYLIPSGLEIMNDYNNGVVENDNMSDENKRKVIKDFINSIKSNYFAKIGIFIQTIADLTEPEQRKPFSEVLPELFPHWFDKNYSKFILKRVNSKSVHFDEIYTFLAFLIEYRHMHTLSLPELCLYLMREPSQISLQLLVDAINVSKNHIKKIASQIEEINKKVSEHDDILNDHEEKIKLLSSPDKTEIKQLIKKVK
ncbi:MAG: hypothetical protein QXT63_06960 [Thermoplasmata archaeon]